MAAVFLKMLKEKSPVCPGYAAPKTSSSFPNSVSPEEKRLNWGMKKSTIEMLSLPASYSPFHLRN
jgi:hypothetical protein